MNLQIGQETESQIEAKNKEIHDMCLRKMNEELAKHPHTCNCNTSNGSGIGAMIAIAVGILLMLIIIL